MPKLAFSMMAIALSVATSGCGQPDVAKHPRPFQSDVWKNPGVSDVRCAMVADLRDRIGLEGKTNAEMIALLGPPSDDGEGGTHYHLCPSFTDVWILEIHWKNGRISSTAIRDT